MPIPKSVEAEMALLGSMIMDPACIGEVAEVVQPADFWCIPNRTIYETILRVWSDRGDRLDVVGVREALARDETLERVGGVAYLVELAESVPSAANSSGYAADVADTGRYRQIMETIERHGRKERDGRTSQTVLDEIDAALYSLRDRAEHQDEAEPVGEILQRSYDLAAQQADPRYGGLFTGFHQLDEMSGGLFRSDVVILAARPSIGKTSLAMSIALNVARNNAGVLIFSLEMPREHLGWRLIAMDAGVDLLRLRTGQLDSGSFSRAAESVGRLNDVPIWIDDRSGVSSAQLRARIRRIARRHPIRLIVIDYLQLMATAGRNLTEETTALATEIQAMAREANVPILLLSQLNREPESRHDHRPRMSDLRQSGALEQIADMVLMLHREHFYHADDREWEASHPELIGAGELVIAKQRNGPTGSVPLRFDAPHARFSSA